ncbi:hypothetical protein CRG49_005280 [Neisseria sp. N95_16]|uniref:Uncharacterized protein n=1 Tax=Neisseria brasiliensis TaxID=2666100 RepID=A0A5Q3RZ29_9NEIS|nr:MULTISPECIES: hypothetical protein [Neisseria]MRN38121.1 hypothetical protein [Neisseria brasiliensis]PJO09890.1 hypothetical protein CRG49_005280 [Neisseria sp. N95_16]PJO79035.1 hypothetical protein CWC45_01795 [Neisseria sp. N177_16]QGL25111.1 hypothetical protein GJV52_05915 [Neisseria brasiliensis]
MKEISLKDLELIYGGMAIIREVGKQAIKISSKPATQGAAIGGVTHIGENYIKQQLNTAPGIIGAMAGGAVGAGLAKSPLGGLIGDWTGAAVEQTLAGKSPLRKEFHNQSTNDKSGNDYGDRSGNSYGG